MQKGDEGATRRKRHEEEGVKCCLTAGPLTGCPCPPDFHSLIRVIVSDKKIQDKGLVMESWGLLHAAGNCHSETLRPSPFILTPSYTTSPSHLYKSSHPFLLV